MYRNNLVRTTLSVFVACTLLYTASASAQYSTQLNSPALTPEFSDAPVVTSLGPLLSEDITGDESYTPEVITMRQATATEEAPTMTLAQAEPELPQLETPAGFIVFLFEDGVVASGEGAQGVDRYIFKLYLGGDTSSTALGTRSIQNNSLTTGANFLGLEPLTHYTVEIIARADNYRDSNPRVMTVRTAKGIINAPTESQLVITPSTDNITVTFENTQSGVNGYALSIRERFDDMGIARSTQNVTISDSPITFTDLVRNGAYTLMALPTFESERYEYSGGIVSLDFATRNLLQPQLEAPAVFVVFVPSNGDEVGVTLVGAQGVDRYIFKLYLGGDTSSTALDTKSIPNDSIVIEVAFPGLEPFTQYTVEIIARADNYRDSNPRVVTERTGKGIINAPTESKLVITPSTDNITVTFEDTQPGVNGYALSIRKRFDDLGIARSTQNVTISDSPVTFADLVPNGAYTLMALPIFESERYEYSGGIVSLDFVVNTSLRLRLRAFLEGPLQ